MTLIGVPPLVREDPVETVWGTNDSRDGASYLTDLPYGDLDGDGIVDVAVGRLPADPELAMAMLNRSRRESGKRAFVASAYLAADWPSVLASRGGGMWQGKLVEQLLARQGYRVNRSVEHRADTQAFIRSLSPLGVRRTVMETRLAARLAAQRLGASAGALAGGAVFGIRALQRAEHGLRQYLEYNWSTAGLDRDRAIARLRGGRDLSALARDIVMAAARTGYRLPVAGMDLRDTALTAAWALLWPDRYPRLTPENVRDGIRAADVIHYTGAGNGSAWLLPPNRSGKRRIPADTVPPTSARLVMDASSLGARINRSRPQLWRAFLERGAAAYLGSSAATYTPYTTELAARFHSRGHTVGEAFRQAVNSMATDTLDWPTPEILARDGVRGKMLRSFILWGDPTMRKDPPIQPDRWETRRDCTGTRCTVTFTAHPSSRVATVNGERVLHMAADGTIFRAGRPQIPLFKTRFGLPGRAEILETGTTVETHTVRDVTVPVTRLASAGGPVPDVPPRDGVFPRNLSRVTVRDTYDNRTVIDIAHAGVRYDPASRTAAVMDAITVTVTYRTPLDLAIAAPDTAVAEENVSMDFTAWSDAPRNATLHLRTANATTVRHRTVPIALARGRTAQDVPVHLPVSGNWSVEVSLAADGDVAGPRTTTITAVPADPRIEAVRLPRTVTEGDRILTDITLANPLPRPRRTTVHVPASPAIQPVFMEPGTRTVTVPATGERTVTVPLRAFADGPAAVRVTAGNASRTVPVQVRDRTLIDRFTATVRGTVLEARPGITVTPGTATWRGAESVLRVDRAGENRTVILSTPDRTVRLVTGRDGVTRSLETPRGRITVRDRPGGTTVEQTGTVTQDALAHRTAVLRRELHKLQRLIAARDGTGSNRYPGWNRSSPAALP